MTNQQRVEKQRSKNDCTTPIHYILDSHTARSTSGRDNELKPFPKRSFNGFLNTMNRNTSDANSNQHQKTYTVIHNSII